MAANVCARCYRCGTGIADQGSVVYDYATDVTGVGRLVEVCWGCHVGEPAPVLWSECPDCGIASDGVPCVFCAEEG